MPTPRRCRWRSPAAGVADAAIGLVMGSAAVVQIPAALVGGRLLDTFGGRGCSSSAGIAYLARGGRPAAAGRRAGRQPRPLRGRADPPGRRHRMALPAALSLVPRLVPADTARRRPLDHGRRAQRHAGGDAGAVARDPRRDLVRGVAACPRPSSPASCSPRLPCGPGARPDHDGGRQPPLRDHVPPRVDHAAADRHAYVAHWGVVTPISRSAPRRPAPTSACSSSPTASRSS